MKTIHHFINGEYRPSIHGSTMEIINPATGNVYATLAAGDEHDVQSAVAAAKNASASWARTPLAKRQAILQRISDLILENIESFIAAEVEDSGKPASLARRLDIPRAASNFAFFAAASSQLATETHYMPAEALNYTIREPIGVVGCISPWNLPLYLYTWKIAPAIAAGNTVVSKPSEITPYTASMLGDICNKAGLPAGVLNIVQGTGPVVGEAIVRHEEVKAISFTGSTAVGKRIAGICAEQLKKSSLELGGKNPVIIFADCDYDEMLKTTLKSSFWNQGQICLCGSRIFVQRSIYEKFVADFSAATKKMKLGDPNHPDTEVGALISESHLQKVLSYIDLAEQEGGTIVTGGKQIQMPAPNDHGYFIEPTIITGLLNDCRTNQEEIFGPMVTVMPFDTENEAISMANHSTYGLASVIWTNHLARAHRVAGSLHTGIVWVNCWLLRDLRTPFGGMKQSGIGREGGWEAIKFFTESKNVAIAYEH
ncbi:MAG TPA: aldehyde dehydrogenase [Saprospiraceae bacterium]|nr:aldehyde dehydrogenase [Saprospiraceae bacterium]